MFVQLLGWIGVGQLWTEAVSDSDYNGRERHLERQRHFANDDKVELDKGSGDFNVLPFTNACNKAYHAEMVAWRCGQQLVLQPEWAESDKNFVEIKYCSLHQWQLIKRAVKVCKRAWFIRGGFLPNISPKQLNDAWTTWAFQANLMFSPVL